MRNAKESTDDHFQITNTFTREAVKIKSFHGKNWFEMINLG